MYLNFKKVNRDWKTKSYLRKSAFVTEPKATAEPTRHNPVPVQSALLKANKAATRLITPVSIAAKIAIPTTILPLAIVFPPIFDLSCEFT
jgi:hypothetical protein